VVIDTFSSHGINPLGIQQHDSEFSTMIARPA